MNTDLKNSYTKYSIPFVSLDGITILDDTVRTYGDNVFVDTSCSIPFKCSNKDWCRIKRALGIEKPVYKKKKKGKRYVLYEVI